MFFLTTAIILGLCLSAMGIGIFLSIKVFNIPDITTDGSFTFGAVITAILLTHNCPLLLVAILSIFGGALCGFITALIHTKLKIDALLAGTITITAMYSINLCIMQRSNIPLINTANIFSLFNTSNLASQMIIVVSIIVALAGLVVYILKTDFGIAMRATGNNPQMVAAMGINNNTMKLIGLALANGFTGFAGFLVTQYQNFADINMGIGIVITGLGCVLIADACGNFLGITSIVGKIVLIIISSIIFQLLLAATLSIGINPNYLKLCSALFVLLFVGITKIKLKNTSND
jgi:putative tryptophan/tyrosine transport system permease protein